MNPRPKDKDAAEKEIAENRKRKEWNTLTRRKIGEKGENVAAMEEVAKWKEEERLEKG